MFSRRLFAPRDDLFIRITAVARTTGTVSKPGHCIVGEIVIDAKSKIPRQRLIKLLGSRIDTVDNPSRAPHASSHTLVEERKKIGSLLISDRYKAIDREKPIMARRANCRVRKDLALIMRIRNNPGQIR